MAMKSIRRQEELTICPRCNSEKLLFIEGQLTRWATCPKCKFKKLLEKTERGTVKVTPMMSEKSNF